MTVAVATAGPRLEVSSIDKSFGAVPALSAVSLALAGGEVVALVGENGAGKSTLIKILAGIFPPDAGEVRIDGAAAAITSPREAMARGIAVIHQEPMLCDNLSIAANLFLGREPLRFPRLGWIDRGRREREARGALERIGLDQEPGRRVGALGAAARQQVEIARALLQEARFVVMDEPTSSLDRRDTARLLALIGELRARGIGVLYVSHRLEEVVAIADRAVVLRDGRVAGGLARGEVGVDALVRLMIGAAAASSVRGDSANVRPGATTGAPPPAVLRVEELRVGPGSPAVSFELRAGEILGLFGLVGAGRTELVETLFGLRRAADGGLALVSASSRGDGAERAFAPSSSADAIAAGMALVPEDRTRHGLVAEMSVADNLGLPALARRPLLGWRDRGRERRRAAALCETLDIRPRRPEIEARRLSGGNQQKVVLGKWEGMEGVVNTTPSMADEFGAADGAGEDAAGAADGAPADGAAAAGASGFRILLLDEPTRGVDVGARAEIHGRLRQLAARGVAILLSSAETDEVLALADRVLVLRRGAIAGRLEGDDRTEENLLRLAAGAA